MYDENTAQTENNTKHHRGFWNYSQQICNSVVLLAEASNIFNQAK